MIPAVPYDTALAERLLKMPPSQATDAKLISRQAHDLWSSGQHREAATLFAVAAEVANEHAGAGISEFMRYYSRAAVTLNMAGRREQAKPLLEAVIEYDWAAAGLANDRYFIEWAFCELLKNAADEGREPFMALFQAALIRCRNLGREFLTCNHPNQETLLETAIRVGALDVAVRIAALIRARAPISPEARRLLETVDEAKTMDEASEPVLSAILLAQSAIKATPTDLPALDALCEDHRSDVRLGAVQAVAWALRRHGDTDGLTHRLAARLDDAAPSVAAQAANGVRDGIRAKVVLGDVGAGVLSRLCRGINSGNSESIATFLAEYAASNPERREGVLAAMSGATPGARAAWLARVLCCGRLGSRQEWGETIGEPDVPPPPEFTRLRRAGESPEGHYQLYRCPDCGTLFQIQVDEQDGQGGNSTWDWYTLTPWGSPDDRSVHDAVASRDVGGLATKLQSADPGICLTVLRTLRPLVRSGIDVRALESPLRQLLSSIPDLAEAAAEVLASSLLETDRGQDVDDLLVSSRREVVWGVLGALWWAGQGTKTELRARFRNVPALLESDDETTRRKTRAALLTEGGLKSADATTAAALTRLLDDDRKDVRDNAASLLWRLAEQGFDIRSAIPKLKDLAAKGSTVPAKSAVVEAAVSIALKGEIGPLLDALRTDPGEMALVRGLYHCQERGIDVSAAFEALGASLTSDRTDGNQWALSTLKNAVEKGLDVSPAAPGLRHLIATHATESDPVRGYRGVGAAEILIRHLAQRQEWADLETLLRSLHVEWLPGLSWAVRVAVGMVRKEALLLAARPRKGPAVTEWSARDQHIKVGDSGIVSWRETVSWRGADDTWSFDEFLGESPTASMRWRWVYDTFGPQVLAEIVEAARTRQAPPRDRS